MSLWEVVFGSWETPDMTNPSRSTRNTTKWMPPHGSAGKYKKCSRFYALQFALAVMISCFVELNFRIQENDFSLESCALDTTDTLFRLFYIFLLYNVPAWLNLWEMMPFGIFISAFGKMSNLRIVSPQNYRHYIENGFVFFLLVL